MLNSNYSYNPLLAVNDWNKKGSEISSVFKFLFALRKSLLNNGYCSALKPKVAYAEEALVMRQSLRRTAARGLSIVYDIIIPD